MRRNPRHSHRCQGCGAKTPCDGQLQDNFDGEPEIVCDDFHLPNGEVNADFICSACNEKRLDEEERRTHWIPPFTQNGPGKTQRAVCGTYVNAAAFSTEPTCDACRAELDDDVATALALETEFQEFAGKLEIR